MRQYVSTEVGQKSAVNFHRTFNTVPQKSHLAFTKWLFNH
ncbi:hypothetical protein CF65_01210 [Aggregatibacter actinomycetemcomitans HK1651]|nr:hypothetical protein ANH9381_0834 [Aggregatibacter actinomycetemcomitans ANH9381]AHN71622.1 hypothetical protein CF65_01210 [Aggregatibacter actinomycetemcomitans HK1651]